MTASLSCGSKSISQPGQQRKVQLKQLFLNLLSISLSININHCGVHDQEFNDVFGPLAKKEVDLLTLNLFKPDLINDVARNDNHLKKVIKYIIYYQINEISQELRMLSRSLSVY